MTQPTLRETQQLFWRLISAPKGAAPAFASLTAAERLQAEAMVRSHGTLPPVERLEIYAGMYFYRIRDCLKDDFPTVCAVIGEVPFHNLITDYLLMHPPSHFSLRHAGQHLPAFVATHEIRQQRPDLADLTALEWAIVEVFDAVDAEPVEASTLADVPSEGWGDLRFELIPATRLLHLGWPVHQVWQQVQREEALSAPDATPTTLCVWRHDLRVFHRAVDDTEMQALRAIQRGASFAEVCITIADDIGESESATQGAQLLARWVEDGLLIRTQSPEHRSQTQD